MLDKMLVVAGQVVTLFLLMGVGFALVRLNKLDDRGLGQMSTILLYVVNPCIFIEAFQQPGLPSLGGLAVGAVALGVYYVAFIPLTALFFRREDAHTGPVLRYGQLYGNSGFMGLPLLAMVLGPEALVFGALALAVFVLAQWTHGVVLMGGRLSFRAVLLNPAVLALILCVPIVIFEWRLPATVNTAVSFLADLNSPLAMVVIGGQMAGANLAATFTQKKLYLASGVKLLLLPALMAVILLPFRLSPLLFCTCVVLAATPVGGTTGIFAQRFEKDTATAAQLITLSTLLSVLTLPFFAVLAQMLSA